MKMILLLGAMLVPLASTPTSAQPPLTINACEGSEPYAWQNRRPAPFLFVLPLLPPVAVITAASLNTGSPPAGCLLGHIFTRGLNHPHIEHYQ